MFTVNDVKPFPLVYFGLVLLLSCTELNEIPEKVLFLGDSQVRNWDVDYWFPSNSNINKGVSGYTIPELINDMQDSPTTDKKVVLVGINDIINLSQIVKEQQVVDSLINMFRILTEHLTSEDFVLSICPVSQKFNESHLTDLNRLISSVNDELEVLCASRNIHFIDIYDSLSDGSILRADLTQDGLHLNYKGYEIISKTLRLHLF